MAPKRIDIPDPTKLPGAILILTVTLNPTKAIPKPKSYTLIAYDPAIQNNDRFNADCVARWNKQKNLPYREKFTEDTIAKFGPDDYYSGVFGKTENKTIHSQAWPYEDDDKSLVKEGISIALWKQDAERRGLFTHAAGKRFDSKSKTSIMTLIDGKNMELLSDVTKPILSEVKSIKLAYYAMQGDSTIRLKE